MCFQRLYHISLVKPNLSMRAAEASLYLLMTKDAALPSNRRRAQWDKEKLRSMLRSCSWLTVDHRLVLDRDIHRSHDAGFIHRQLRHVRWISGTERLAWPQRRCGVSPTWYCHTAEIAECDKGQYSESTHASSIVASSVFRILEICSDRDCSFCSITKTEFTSTSFVEH